jgi:CheY-like chemotaxis protein
MSEQKTVLVVDDDKVLRTALQTKFSAKGYAVVLCANGQDAMDALQNQEFDVILTDLHMPEKDGFTVLKEMQSTRNKNTPTYVITNLGTDQYCDRAIELGAKKCFVKSLVTLKDVVELVNTELGS